MRIPRALGGVAAVALAATFALPADAPRSVNAASHREAPLISMDPTADITDFFMFRSYETGKDDKVVLIMDVFPGEEPSSAPNYFLFDPNVRYAFNIDNDKDGKADDVTIEFAFSTEIRGTVAALDLFLGYLGCGSGCAAAGTAALPPITALDGPGSQGLGLRQKYTVTMITKSKRDRNDRDRDDGDRSEGRRTVLASGLIAVPSNVGPRTMPNYDALAAQGINTLSNGMRVFAGQRDDPFYIDLGGVFDTLNLRRTPPVENPAEDANDNVNPFGTDMLSGFNVNTIAIELPASMLTADGKTISATSQPNIGAYASTSRRKTRVLRAPENDDREARDDRGTRDLVKTSGDWVQIQRLANPLINETIIGTEDKDEWNFTEPEDESQFIKYYNDPRLALALELVVGVPAQCPSCTDKTPRAGVFNLRDLLLKYQASDTRLSELLRLNLSVPPTPLAQQHRLTALAGDAAGWPNGRRPKDDVTDVAVRVVGGPNYVNARAADGVNTNDRALSATFPFIASPWDGRNRVHQNGPSCPCD